MGIAFEDNELPIVETTSNEEEEEYIEDDEASDAESESELSISEYGGSVTGLPPWCLFSVKECRCIFELGQDKAIFYRVCGNVQGSCKRQGHATGEKAAVGYYEPVKARKFVDGKFNTFLSMEEFAGKEQERMGAKAKELAMASARFSPLKTSPTSSEDDLYFKARPADVRLLAHQPKGPAVAAKAFKPSPKSVREAKSSLKTPPKYSTNQKFVDKLGSLDTAFSTKDAPGLGGSPTLKTLNATGVKTETMDPATVMMLAMVDQLTASMAQLATKVEEISTEKQAPEIKPRLVETKKERTEGTKSSKEPKPKYFYGVGHGHNGIFGVYHSWGEVGPLVVGVSKAIFQRFGNQQEAQDFVDAIQALKQQQTEAQPSGTVVSDTWYAITNSKTGHYDIFPSWPEAQSHVINVSGASVRKFRTYGEAQLYVEGHASAWEQRPSEGASLRENRLADHKMPAKPTFENYHVSTEAIQVQPRSPKVTTTGGPLALYPPSILMGTDPSTGKSEEVFNIDVEISEEELQDALCPPDLAESMARSLINGTIDAVALPGGLNSGGELEESAGDVGVIGEALEELVSQNRGSTGKTGRTDLRWRTEKRTSIRGITSEAKLKTRIKHLKKLMPKVQKRMETLTSTACKRSGWSDLTRIHTWSTYGYLPVIVMSSLRWYLELHEHLLELSLECGWHYITTELDHHAEEMSLLRTLADTRIHAICSLYGYLRDCKDKNWYSTTIQQQRNVAMVSQIIPATGTRSFPAPVTPASNRGTGMAALCCRKCRTCLHTGGEEECPWKNQTDENARASGAKALKSLASGNIPRKKGGAKDKENQGGD
jgi:viroplasmin and RNaseH domain-containing protein